MKSRTAQLGYRDHRAHFDVTLDQDGIIDEVVVTIPGFDLDAEALRRIPVAHLRADAIKQVWTRLGSPEQAEVTRLVALGRTRMDLISMFPDVSPQTVTRRIRVAEKELGL